MIQVSEFELRKEVIDLTKLREPVENLHHLKGTTYVATGVTSLTIHGYASRTPGYYEVETEGKTLDTGTGIILINSGFNDEEPIYDEDLGFHYTSLFKAMLDTLTFCIDNSALEAALIDFEDEGLIPGFRAYLSENKIDAKILDEAIAEYLD